MSLGNSWLAGLAGAVVFGTPKEMTQQDIEAVISQFANAARLASLAGLQGVEIHMGRKQILCDRSDTIMDSIEDC